MTRFARAKGSKSSNEKKPEEATSWAEMKNSMLSKKTIKAEEFKPKENVESDIPKKTKWASLGDDQSNFTSLLKQNLNKKNKDCIRFSNDSKSEKVKTERKNADNLKKKIKIANEESNFKKKNKKREHLISEELSSNKSGTSVKKKNKKRAFSGAEEDSEVVPSTKRKKLMKTPGIISDVREKKQEQNLKNKEIKDHKKFHKMKKEMKTKYFKKEVKENFKSKSRKQINEKFGKQSKGKKRFTNKGIEEENSRVEELIISGEKIPIVKFQGFYVTLEDAERLKKLRSEMIKEGIPKVKLEAAIKLERRRAEKALSRLKKSLCFHCRGHGHLLSSCPKLTENESTSTGICYKCGSTEHSAAECKVVKEASYQFAECFICKEQGHIARQCPDNPKGLYPQGGACRECGDVTHLKKDCPRVIAQKAEEVVTVGLRNDRNLECLDEEIAYREKQNVKNKTKKNFAVKF